MNSGCSMWEAIKHPRKRTIAGWILCVLAMIIAYPVMHVIDIKAVDSINSYGVYSVVGDYLTAMNDNVLNGMELYPVYAIITACLAIIIPMQSFSYLFSRRRVNFFMSIPVSRNKRFKELYCRGIGMYGFALGISVLISAILMQIRGIASKTLMGKLFQSAILCLLLFAVIYNLTIGAMMLTGKFLMAIVLDVIILIYVDGIQRLLDVYKAVYYKTLCTGYKEASSGISILDIFTYTNHLITNPYKNWGDIWGDYLVAIIKLLIWGVIGYTFAYGNYKKRPSEAAESVVAFYSSRILIKLLVSVPVALGIGIYAHTVLGCNQIVMLIIVIVSVIVIGMLLEIAFNMAVISSLRHWGSIIVSVLFALAILGFFRFDVIRFDKYLPSASSIESFAVLNAYEPSYSEAINFEAYPLDYESTYIDAYSYARENMQLLDTDTIVRLATKSQNTSPEEMSCAVPFDVLYRLKSGATRARKIWIDIDDRSNDAYLNRLIGPAYYKRGIWQAFDSMIPDNMSVEKMTYFDGICAHSLDVNQASRVIALWRSDMVGYDYNRIRYYREAGYINISFNNYMTWTLPVYDGFSQVQSYLKMGEGIEPLMITAEEVDAIVISSKAGDKAVEVTDKEDIAAVLSCLELVPVHHGWIPENRYQNDCKVEIQLNESYTNIYGCNSLYSYSVLTERVDVLNNMGLMP